jgi:hypothetical protein
MLGDAFRFRQLGSIDDGARTWYHGSSKNDHLAQHRKSAFKNRLAVRVPNTSFAAQAGAAQKLALFKRAAGLEEGKDGSIVGIDAQD